MITSDLSRHRDKWKKYYDYSEHKIFFRTSILSRNHLYTVKEVRRTSSSNEDETGHHFLTIFETHKPMAPTILISPIFRGSRMGRFVGRFFAKKGLNAVVVHQETFDFDYEKGFEQIEEYLKKAVIRNLQALDWISTHQKTDQEKIGTFGISFGAMIGSIVASLDERPKCHVIALGGGPIADIIAKTRNPLVLKLSRQVSKHRSQSRKALASDIFSYIKSDPLTFAPYVEKSKVAMYVGIFDRVVRPACAMRLWQALGRPRTFFAPFGHYTSIVSFPYAGRLAYQFFKEKMNFN